MNNVPKKLRKELSGDPEYSRCALIGYHECGGRITWEHAIIFAAKQVQARWAIIPLCAAGQNVDQYQDSGRMDKKRNVWVALNRATGQELRSVSKSVDYVFERERLNAIYGPYLAPRIPQPANYPSPFRAHA